MRYRSHNAKRDESEPAIVEALEAAGWEVHRELPIDLLCLKQINGKFHVKLLECKTARGKRKPKAVIDKRQETQNAFCERWNISKPTNADEALLAVEEMAVI